MFYVVFITLGMIVGLLIAIIVLILYSRQEQIITRFIDRRVQNKEKAQFYDPITPEEQLNEIFNIKE